MPRVLGPWMATAIVIGGIIGSGIFAKPKAVAESVPEIGLAMSGWVLVGILTMIGALVLAEIATLYPHAGGIYVYLREGLGRWAGFLWGWVEFGVIRSASIAALAELFVESLHDVIRHARGFSPSQNVFEFEMQQAMTIAVIGTLAVVNARGTRLGGIVQVAISSVKMGTLLAIALAPFVIAGIFRAPISNLDVPPEAMWPSTFDLGGVSRFGTALVGILFAYQGATNLAPVAEEIDSPNRNIPIAFVAGVLCVIVAYVSANIAYFLVLPVEDIRNLEGGTVAASFAERLFGPVGLLLASAAVMISVFGTLNASLLVGPRLLVGMGRDGLAPASLACLHPRFKTPARATMVLAGWAIVLVVGASILMRGGFLTGTMSLYDLLSDYSMFGAIAFETLGLATIFVFRCRAGHRDPEAYRTPLYPVLPAIYILAMAAVLANMFWTQRLQSIVAVCYVGVGALTYLLFFRKNEPESRAQASGKSQC